jgi:hypothetical protein
MENQNQDNARQQRKPSRPTCSTCPATIPGGLAWLDQIDRARRQEADTGRASEANTIGGGQRPHRRPRESPTTSAAARA